MKLGKDGLMVLLLVSSSAIQAGEVAAPTVAKVIRIVAASGKVACLDPEVAAELSKLGVSLDPEAQIGWAISDKDVSRFAKQNKLVICGQVGQLGQGASIAIVAEGGRPVIYISPASASLSKVSLPDALIKIGKVVK